MWEGNVTPCWGEGVCQNHLWAFFKLHLPQRNFDNSPWPHHHYKQSYLLLKHQGPYEPLFLMSGLSYHLGGIGQEVSWEPPSQWIYFPPCFVWPSVLRCGEGSQLCPEESGLWICTSLPILHMQGCSCSLHEEGGKCSLRSHCSEYYHRAQRRYDLCSENCWELCNFHILNMVLLVRHLLADWPGSNSMNLEI